MAIEGKGVSSYPWHTLIFRGSGSCWKRILTPAHVHILACSWDLDQKAPNPSPVWSSRSKQVLPSFCLWQTCQWLSDLQIWVRLSFSKLGLTVTLWFFFCCCFGFFLLCCNSTCSPLRCGVLLVVLRSVAAPLKQTLVHQPQRLFSERKAAFLQTPRRCPAWKLRSLRKIKMQNVYNSCRYPVMFALSFFPMWLDVWFNLTVLMSKRQQRLSWIQLFLVVFREAVSHTNASPIFALEVPFRGHCSHASEVHVCRGTSPHPRVTSADFLTLIYLWNPSYLS